MADSSKAVFLSYASQDAEAAKRICEALRQAGVEVWFDQNELVGGDAWDAKIRKQIKDCALLIPIISQNTQARTEGYFRLEWRLADQRTHLMAKGRAFLLPVVVDGTKDTDAHVPDSFLEVQWTKALGGDVSAAFVSRVKALLAGEAPRAKGQGAASRPQNLEPSTGNLRPTWKAYAGLALGALVIAAGATWFILRPRHSPEDIAKIVADAQAVAAKAAPPAIPLSEARKLLAQAKALIEDDPLRVRENYRAAAELGARATALSPDDAEAWAIYARATTSLIFGYNEKSDKQVAAARSQAERAMRLAPDSIESGLAMAFFDAVAGAGPDAAEERLRTLLVRAPTERRILELLALIAGDVKENVDECRGWAERADALPGGSPLALEQLAWAYWGTNRFVELEQVLDRIFARRPTSVAYHLKLMVLRSWGDLDGVLAWLEKTPPAVLAEDRVVSLAVETYRMKGQPEKALALLARIPREFLEEGRYLAPKSYLVGQLLHSSGKTRAAEVEFRAALKSIEERLAVNPREAELFMWRGRVMVQLGDKAEAARQFAIGRELGADSTVNLAAADEVMLGNYDAAMAEADRRLQRERSRWPSFLTDLKYGPEYAPVRDDPRFQALLARGQGWLDEMRGAPKAAQADAKSVAVLAFANLSSDREQEYFSDGISEELLNVLAKVPGLKVTARTSSFFFKGKEVPIPEIAKQLGVAYVIEGSVRKAGDKVRITAQLIKAADGFHVWSDTFTRDLKDVFAVQDEIAGLIAQQLQLKLGGTSRAKQPVNPEAYDLYLRARALSRLEDENYLPIIKLYEAAVAKDPEFALAYVQLSLARASDYWSGGLDSKPAARAALQAAQRLAPDAPETRLAAGSYAYSCENDWNLARTEFLAAEAGLPGDAQVAFFLGMVQRRLLSFDESIRQVARATELDPTDRNNFAQQVHTLKALRRYPELVDLTAAALKRFPADENFLQVQAIALREIERDQAAYVRRVRELPAGEARARVLKDYFLALNAGEWEAAGRILAESKLEYVPNTPASTKDPVALQQAMLAHLQGRTEQARRLGAEAVAYYQAQHWSLRQDKWLQLGRALALAYAGRGPEAMGLARETLAATALRDPWDTVILHTSAAQVYLAAGHRDEALAELRIMMSGPCLQGAEELRRDPLWRTVKDDPRFEEILRSARRL